MEKKERDRGLDKIRRDAGELDGDALQPGEEREILDALRQAVESMQLGVTITDTGGRIVYTNPAEAAMHGYTVDELIGASVRIFAPCELWQPLKPEQYRELRSFHRECANVRKDGSIFPVQLFSDVFRNKRGEPIGIVTTSEDITARKQAEEALRQAQVELERRVDERTAQLTRTIEKLKEEIRERKKAEEEKKHLQSQLLQIQKMESIGRLAGGIAHDFNNILSGIIGYAELSLIGLSEGYPLRKNLVTIREAGEKAASLTRQLLAFSRKQLLEIKVVDLNGLITQFSRMLNRLIGENIRLEVRPGHGARHILADPGQVEQVLMNLAVNARDAMPDGGFLTIATEDADVREGVSYSHGTIGPGSYVVLSVMDTGIGMSREIMNHVFEPFFTTKEVGKGTGLGLSTVYGIVNQHNGHIVVSSEPGKGSTFKVYWPASLRRAEAAGERRESPLPPGSETVLVVEDDESVRRLIMDTLAPLGYRLMGAAGGEEALDAAARWGQGIDLLLTDVIMPGMNGWELAETFTARFPASKVLFMTGYADELIGKTTLRQGTAILQKPLTPKRIANTIRKILDKGVSEGQ